VTRTRDEYIADPKEDRGVWIMYGLARLGRNERGTLSLQRPWKTDSCYPQDARFEVADRWE
jgi:hypothetical protein